MTRKVQYIQSNPDKIYFSIDDERHLVAIGTPVKKTGYGIGISGERRIVHNQKYLEKREWGL